MESDFDLNKVVAEFLSTKIDSALELVRLQAKGARDIVRSKFEQTYRTYLERVLERHSKGKSFFNRFEPTPLYSFFVPLDLKTQKSVLPRVSIGDLAQRFPHCIITGSGGSGKTMLMRHLLVGAIQQRIRTPIFLELRQMNTTDGGVREALIEVLNHNGLDVAGEYFDLAMQKGHFALLLDGFDELQFDRRERVSAEIRRMSDRYPGNLLILSSRSDEKLEGWGDFAKLQVCPLNLERAAELISLVPFEEPVKQRFIKDLKSNLFWRHESFLSNPLLLSIMLLTYREAAHIPSKLSVFYGQAYESLFQKHDALKAGFRRERRTALDIKDFERVFSAFCIQGFEKREFSFSRVRAAELIESAKNLVRLSCDATAFLDDCIQATCLLIEEGLDLTFAHRSFQEYFAARFIAVAPERLKSKLIQRFAATQQSDIVLILLHEIDPYAVEEYYILPAIREFQKIVGSDARASNDERRLAYVKQYWHALSTEGHGHVSYSHGAISPTPLRFAVKQYGWPKDGRSFTPDSVIDAIKETADESTDYAWSVSTASLSTDHKLFKATRDDSLIGALFIKRVLEIASEIEQKHRDMNDSIERIINSEEGRKGVERRPSARKYAR